MTASRAARRSGSRCCRCTCSGRSSRCSTRPTRGSTSMRCRSSRAASRRFAHRMWASCSSRTTSASCGTSPRTSFTSSSTGASCAPAGASSPRSSRRRATTSSAKSCTRGRHEHRPSGEPMAVTVRNAASSREVIFVRNATEGVNLVAYTWGREHVKAGDRIVSTVLEHHSNFVPWQQLAKDVGAEIVMIDVDDDGRLRRDQYAAALAKGRVKLVAITATSNGLGTVLPIKELVAEAKAVGASVLVDAAQAVPHQRVDVRDIGADFLVFSGHKMIAPPGSGAVWAREALLTQMRPFLYGGDM